MNIINKLLTPNKYSRPQIPLKQIKGIVIHWVANPNSTAIANRNYFENKKSGTDGYGSAHQIIDLNGDIITCIPENEIAYHCGSKTYTQDCLNRLGNIPNYYTYGIECTHIDNNGKMTNDTYNSLLQRCVDLCKIYKLNPLKDLWTHHEIVGWKDCHRWFTNNPNEWTNFKQKVSDRLNNINQPQPIQPIPQQSNQPEQWKLDCVKFLLDNKYIKSPHKFDEIITINTIGYIFNNATINESNITPTTWLMKHGYTKSLHQADEQLTISVLAYMLANKMKENITMSPLDWLLQKGFITQKRTDKNELITMWLLGAILKNGRNNGFDLSNYC